MPPSRWRRWIVPSESVGIAWGVMSRLPISPDSRSPCAQREPLNRPPLLAVLSLALRFPRTSPRLALAYDAIAAEYRCHDDGNLGRYSPSQQLGPYREATPLFVIEAQSPCTELSS